MRNPEPETTSGVSTVFVERVTNGCCDASSDIATPIQAHLNLDVAFSRPNTFLEGKIAKVPSTECAKKDGKQTHRQAGRQANRQTDRQTLSLTDRQTDTQTE